MGLDIDLTTRQYSLGIPPVASLYFDLTCLAATMLILSSANAHTIMFGGQASSIGLRKEVLEICNNSHGTQPLGCRLAECLLRSRPDTLLSNMKEDIWDPCLKLVLEECEHLISLPPWPLPP